MAKTVLIVEDDNLARKALATSLRDNGITVEEATDGAAGLETALRIKPDMVVADIRMPNMDGLTMVGKLREDDWGKHVPIIVMTNDDTTETINTALAEGVTAYLSKLSMDPQAIVDQIIVALG